MISYARLGILVGIFMAGLLLGWAYEYRALVAYKAEVKAEAEKQIAKNESIVKQQELVNKTISKEYDAKLALLRQYYANSMHNTSSSTMPTNGFPAKPIDAITAYSILAGQCAEATQQLVSLQDWIKEQTGIK